MLKIIALIKRRADVSRAEFRRHYEEIHAPLALRHLDQMSAYVRNHVTSELAGGPAGFDCLSEFWYADRAALRRLLAYLQSDAAEPIRRDEISFMSKAENVFFPVEEHCVLADRGGVPSEVASKIVVLATRPQGEPTEFFLRRYQAALAAWLEGLPRPLRCVQHVVPAEAAEPQWDAITMLWYAPERAGLRLSPGGPLGVGRCLIVSVDECKMPQPRQGPWPLVRSI
jgi:uncharacterized protein (TIGR02118 family)